jgi:hypothetical protein
VFFQVSITVAGGKRASWPDSYSNAKGSVVSRYKHLTMEFSMRQIEFLKNKSISIGAKNDAIASASNMVGRQA